MCPIVTDLTPSSLKHRTKIIFEALSHDLVGRSYIFKHDRYFPSYRIISKTERTQFASFSSLIHSVPFFFFLIDDKNFPIVDHDGIIVKRKYKRGHFGKSRFQHDLEQENVLSCCILGKAVQEIFHRVMCKTSLFPIIPYILDKFDFCRKYRGWIHKTILRIHPDLRQVCESRPRFTTCQARSILITQRIFKSIILDRFSSKDRKLHAYTSTRVMG